MNKFALLLAAVGISYSASVAAQEETINVYDHVVFYDGYQGEVIDKDVNDGVLRFRNSLYSVKIDNSRLSYIGDNLRMDVTIGALCDNYDRIGNVNLAFVPKGAETYDYQTVDRIEVTRFITPFMNKNKNPREVPYTYEIANVGKILKDKDLQGKYDFWLEFELFGIPYAANQQVAGCADRNDVFDGTINFVFTPLSQPADETGNIVVPIYIKYPEDKGNINFNNYNEQATDTLGVTTRTFEFEIPQDVTDSKIYLILTNHGAASGGEEYVRRQHLVYYDGEIVLSYKPGGVSCEPYRQYNTQGNGIYGTSRPELSWKLNSNWCPGQAVPIRELSLGAQKAGKHKVMIRVPDAQFKGNDGDFRPSLYFHGVTSGEIEAGIDQVWFEGPEIKFTKEGSILNFTTSEDIAEVVIHSYDGRQLGNVYYPRNSIDLAPYAGYGALIVTFITEDNRTTVHRIL